MMAGESGESLYRFQILLVQSLNSLYFPPQIGAEPGRAKGESLLSPARVQPLCGEGRKGSSGTGLRSSQIIGSLLLNTINSRKGQRTNQKYRNLVGYDQQMQKLEKN